MGASGWYYFAPYQENIQNALIQVRQQVFASGDYYHPLSWYRMYVNSPEFTYLSSSDQVEARQQLHVLEIRGLPRTIEALVDENAESGTHSILDIDHISDETEFNAAAPLPPEILIELFGTIQPSRSMVETQLDELQGIRFRWCGTYIVIYDNGQPSEICFVGYSGD